jgi:uncharacterized membrane protein
MKLKDKIFADSEINRSRQWELDLARAVLVFCLALVHVAIECTSDEGLCYGIPYILDTVIGGPFGAPMFMFVMGVGMAYTHRNNPQNHFMRGVKLFVLAYILNICRFVIPYMIGYTITGDQEYYLEMLPYKLFGNDIFTFAGLAMMLMALFIKLKLSHVAMLIIATVMCAFGTLLNGVDAGSPLGNIFLGYLIGTEDAAEMVHSYFPVLNWMLFPVFGYVFGNVLKRVKNKDLFYLLTSLPAMLIAIVYFTYGIRNEVGMFGEGQNCYYHMIFSDVLASLCITVAMVGVYYVILKIFPKKMFYIAWSMSENITAIYFVHWVLVSMVVNVWMYIVRGTTLLTPGQVLALGTAIEIVSIIIAHFYTKWRGRYKVYDKAS